MSTTIVEGPFTQFEAQAQESITPGEMVRYDTNGDIVVDDSDGAAIHGFIAMEFTEVGKDIDDTYSSGEGIKVAVPRPGTRVNAFLQGGEDVDPDTALYVDGSGTLVSSTTATSPSDGGIFGYPTASANPSSNTRIEVRVTN